MRKKEKWRDYKGECLVCSGLISSGFIWCCAFVMLFILKNIHHTYDNDIIERDTADPHYRVSRSIKISDNLAVL